MNTIKLQVFARQCAQCGTRFESLHLGPHDYGVILFETVSSDVAFLFSDDDPVLDEVKDLLRQVDSEGDPVYRFHAALEQTVDRSDSGQVFFVWGDVPCPKCGSRRRTYFGPVDPPRFVDRPAARVTHREWDQLPREAKVERLREAAVVHERRSRGAR